MEWIFIFLWIIAFPIICAVIASAKGRSGIGWLIAGLFFGIFAVILIAILPANSEGIAQNELRKGKKKVCPHCAETILVAARVCRYCGKEVPENVSRQVVMKPCPFCSEPIRQVATGCRHCGNELKTEGSRILI